jgi:hypothetical protein
MVAIVARALAYKQGFRLSRFKPKYYSLSMSTQPMPPLAIVLCCAILFCVVGNVIFDVFY